MARKMVITVLRVGLTLVFTAWLTLPTILFAQVSDPALLSWQKGREYFFTVDPEQVDVRPSAEAPNVFGVIMDWHIPAPQLPSSGVVLTAIAIADGSSSVYTSRGATIIGGYTASAAAKHVVRLAEGLLAIANSTTSHLPPAVSSIRFYIRTYKDLRVIDVVAKEVESGNSAKAALFTAANRVISELRVAAEKQEAQASAPK